MYMPCMSGNFHSENTILFVFKESTIKKLQRWGTPGSSAYREIIFFKHLWGSKLLMMWQVFLELDLDVVGCIDCSSISTVSLPWHSGQGWWYYCASCSSRDSTLIRMPFTPPPIHLLGGLDFDQGRQTTLWSPRKLRAVCWQRSRLGQGAVPEGHSGWHILDMHRTCHVL